MQGKKYLVTAILSCFLLPSAQAICVQNKTSFNLYYEIDNKNTGCCVPKVKFHKGYLSANQKNCHAHSSKDGGGDWKIYRKDIIRVYKIDSTSNKKQVCNKMVEGILNTLEVDFIAGPDSWWCLDRSDYQD